MSPEPAEGRGNLARFPRVSGDEPAYSLVVTPVRVFSPRERG